MELSEQNLSPKAVMLYGAVVNRNQEADGCGVVGGGSVCDQK